MLIPLKKKTDFYENPYEEEEKDDCIENPYEDFIPKDSDIEIVFYKCYLCIH